VKYNYNYENIILLIGKHTRGTAAKPKSEVLSEVKSQISE